MFCNFPPFDRRKLHTISFHSFLFSFFLLLLFFRPNRIDIFRSSENNGNDDAKDREKMRKIRKWKKAGNKKSAAVHKKGGFKHLFSLLNTPIWGRFQGLHFPFLASIRVEEKGRRIRNWKKGGSGKKIFLVNFYYPFFFSHVDVRLSTGGHFDERLQRL